MTREEWMRDLREALEAEMPQNDIDSNISYYRDYIDTECAKRPEDSVLEELGDARLIAHTVIDSYKMQRGSGAYENSWGANSYERTTGAYEDREEDSYAGSGTQYTGDGPKVIKIRWYHKLLLIAFLIAFLVVLGFLGKLAFIVFLRIGIPVILVYLVYSLFKRN